MLTSEHPRTLDDKGRLSLPPAFRALLDNRAFVSISTTKRYLEIWTWSEGHSAVERLQAAVRAGEATDNQLRRFAASLEEVKVDSHGRVSLPNAKREALGLGKNVMLVGVGNRGEVWDPNEWESFIGAPEPDEADISRWL